jgi:teichuronic acid biosynthesis glycosyltransferase TuaH
MQLLRPGNWTGRWMPLQHGGQDRSAPPDGITVLGAQFASIKFLFAPLIGQVDLTFVHVNDWLNELRYRIRPGAFVQMEPLAGVDWQEWRFPPGWTNRWAPWVMPRLAERVERAWRQRGWKNPRLVITFPYFLPVARALGPERAVYYAVDNYQAYWPDRAAALCEQENELIKVAGASVATSSALSDWFRERVPTVAAKIHYLPNGVHGEMIAPAEEVEHGPLALDPKLVRHFGEANGPVVGHYGHVAYDPEFLAAIVARLPDFRFLLMGQVLAGKRYDKGIAHLRKCPNVVMTGRLREPGSLRSLRQCDIVVIPDPLDSQIQYCCPIRLWTFMATGRPVVSTPIPEVIKFGELIYPATTVDEFVDALVRAAQENTPSLVTKRIAIAQEHTWPVLAQRMWSILSSMPR